jgi:cation:H+ antiporter
MLLDIFLIAAGILLLVKGSDILVESASSMAIRAGVPLIVIGLSVVAVGTSLPELVVGVDASLGGAGGIALGNVVGSNIVNVCVVIGIGALIREIKVSPGTFWREIPETIAAAALLMALSLDGSVDRLDGVILLASAALYFYYIYRKAKDEGIDDARDKRPVNSIKELSMICIGIIMTYVGGKITVDSSISVASGLGVSTYLIALTVIAFGTNLPEITTSVLASFKDRGDLILGNGLGSIIVNILLIIGICAIINPIRVDSRLDVFISLAFCIFLIPLLYKNRSISKIEGAVLVLLYVAYLVYKVIFPII